MNRKLIKAPAKDGKRKRIFWTTAMLAQLDRLWPAEPEVDVILRELGLTGADLNAVTVQASRRGLKRLRRSNGARPFSGTEKDLLRLFYPIPDWDLRLKIFYDRDKRALIRKAHELGVKELKPWDAERDKVLRKAFATRSDRQLEQLFGMPIVLIKRRAGQLGLHRPKRFHLKGNGFTQSEKKWMTRLYADAPAYELYFRLPKRSYRVIQEHNRTGERIKRTYVARVTMPDHLLKLLGRCRERTISSGGNLRYRRIGYLELLKSGQPWLAEIKEAEGAFLDYYRDKLIAMARRYVKGKDVHEFCSKDISAQHLAEEAFYVTFEYLLGWPVDDFLKIAKYFLRNRSNLSRNGFYRSGYRGATYTEQSLETYFAGSTEDDPSLERLLPDFDHRYLTIDCCDEIKEILLRILTDPELNFLYEFANSSYSAIDSAAKKRYGSLLVRISRDETFRSLAKEHNQPADMLARMAFIAFM